MKLELHRPQPDMYDGSTHITGRYICPFRLYPFTLPLLRRLPQPSDLHGNSASSGRTDVDMQLHESDSEKWKEFRKTSQRN